MDINSNQQHFDQARNSLELNGLNKIREQSRENNGEAKEAALKEAAQQFEAIFMRMLLTSMRKAQEVLESDSPFNSQSTKFYRDMHDQQMSIELSSNGALGLTDLIVRQLGGDSDNYKPSSVLRNDGNLPINTDNNILADNKDAFVNSTTVTAQSPNSLIEKMLHENKASDTSKESILAKLSNYSDSNVELISNGNVNNPPPVVEQHFTEPKDFVTALIEPAKKVEQELGVPFEVVIAQAALETGWGQKIIKLEDGNSSNNLFNIKADSRWAGDKTTKETLEFEQGAMVKKSEPFRTYQSLSESIDDYIKFLSSNDRYNEALQQSSNVEHFLQGLQKAGYATDPKYADKILGTLKSVTNLIAK